MDEQQHQTDNVTQPTEQPATQPAEQPQSQPQPTAQDAGGWYKFLVYFALFAGALGNFILGILYLTGYIYDMSDVSSELVYMTFRGLQTLDVIFGIVCFMLAAYGIAVRFMLTKFKKKAPLCLYMLYVIVIAVQIIYLILAANIIDVSIGEVVDAQSIATLIIQFICLIISITCFSKRKELFTR